MKITCNNENTATWVDKLARTPPMKPTQQSFTIILDQIQTRTYIIKHVYHKLDFQKINANRGIEISPISANISAY